MRGGRSGPGARPRRRRKSSGMTWAGRGGRAREGLRVSPASRGPREATPTRSPAARPAPGLARGDQGRPVPRGAEALAESLLLWPDHWALPAGLVPEKGRSGPREGEIRPPAQCCPPRRPLPPLRQGPGDLSGPGGRKHPGEWTTEGTTEGASPWTAGPGSQGRRGGGALEDAPAPGGHGPRMMQLSVGPQHVQRASVQENHRILRNNRWCGFQSLVVVRSGLHSISS
nr:uncharacterized protein LOC105102172 isoform X2 [Camelus dromedarius]